MDLPYELLANTTPLKVDKLEESTWPALLKRITQEESPRPSVRLNSSGALKSFAAVCGVDPARLKQMLHGELDWIVLKCLEKDRSLRYETPLGLARDLQRYIANEPVKACPPSFIYCWRKVVRKYRMLIATAASFVILVVAGLVISVILAGQAMVARREAVEARQVAERALANEVDARKVAELARKNAESFVRQFKATTMLGNEKKLTEVEQSSVGKLIATETQNAAVDDIKRLDGVRLFESVTEVYISGLGRVWRSSVTIDGDRFGLTGFMGSKHTLKGLILFDVEDPRSVDLKVDEFDLSDTGAPIKVPASVFHGIYELKDGRLTKFQCRDERGATNQI